MKGGQSVMEVVIQKLFFNEKTGELEERTVDAQQVVVGCGSRKDEEEDGETLEDMERH